MRAENMKLVMMWRLFISSLMEKSRLDTCEQVDQTSLRLKDDVNKWRVQQDEHKHTSDETSFSRFTLYDIAACAN